MINYIGHSSKYWRKNKPSVIGDYKVTTDDWNKLLLVVERSKKCISYNKIANHFQQIKYRQFYKNFLTFKTTATPIPALKEHVILMTYVYDQEKKRQETIENKAKQIITNVSLLFTIIAFSSTIILNKDNYLKNITDISILTVVIILILSFVSIIIAAKCLNVQRYNRPRQEIVFDPQYFGEEEFLKQKVNDFFFCLYGNTLTNTKKSIKVRNANWLFIIAVFFVGFFSLINLYSIHIRNQKTEIRTIQEVKIIDTLNTRIISK